MAQAQDRLTVDRIMAEVRNELGSFERGFWYTAKEVLLRPGATMAAVWRGDRSRYTGPVRFFMLSFTLYALAWVSTGAMAAFWAAQRQAMQAEVEAQGLVGKAPDLGAVYLQHPLVSEFGIVLSMWLMAALWFRGRGLNAAERAALPLYWYGMVNLVQVPLFWVALLGHSIVYVHVMANVGLLYVAWATYTALEPRRWWNALRGVAWWITGGLLWQLVLALTAAAMAGSAAGQAP